MSNKNKSIYEMGNAIDTLEEDVIPENTVVDDVDDGDLYDPDDLEEAMKIVERRKKIKAGAEKALGVAKKAGLVLLGVAIGAVATKGKGIKGNANTTSETVGDTSDDVENTDTIEDVIVDEDVEVENET